MAAICSSYPRAPRSRSDAGHAVTHGEPDQVDEGAGTELVHHVMTMCFHGTPRDEQPRRDLVVGEALHEEVEHLALARREPTERPRIARQELVDLCAGDRGW